MRISDWSSDVCSSDLVEHGAQRALEVVFGGGHGQRHLARQLLPAADAAAAVPALEIVCVVLLGHGHTVQRQIQRPRHCAACLLWPAVSSEEHTSELQSLMRNTYALYCWQHNATR